MSPRIWPGLAAWIFFAALVRADSPPTLQVQLEAVRAKYNLPALGGAIFTTGGVTEMAVTGVRKRSRGMTR
jgi:hypothetical protein